MSGIEGLILSSAVALIPEPPLPISNFTSEWWVQLGILGLITCLIGWSNLVVRRSVERRDRVDEAQAKRIEAIELEQRQQEIRLLEREAVRVEERRQREIELFNREQGHQQKLHELELAMAACRQHEMEAQGKYILRDEYHGDRLRLEQEVRDEIKQLVITVQELHRRIDDAFALGATDAGQ